MSHPPIPTPRQLLEVAEAGAASLVAGAIARSIEQARAGAVVRAQRRELVPEGQERRTPA